MDPILASSVFFVTSLTWKFPRSMERSYFPFTSSFPASCRRVEMERRLSIASLAEQPQLIVTPLGEELDAIPNFQYQPLGDSEIRLLKVRPGGLGSPIHCRMEHVPLKDNPVYIALSVTHNLYIALEQLRAYCERFTRFYVWIDAICIDQSSNEEKSHQVSRMTEVYGNSRKVISWLGAIRDEDEPGMEALFQKFAALSKHEQMPKGKRQSSNVSAAAAEPLAQELYQPLRWLMGRPWFGRVWTLQEGSIGRYSCELHAGRFSTYMRTFQRLCLDSFNLPETTHDIVGCDILRSTRLVRRWTLKARNRYENRDEISESNAAKDLLLLLCGSSSRACLIPHDKIYGILGLWKLVRHHQLPRGLEPDYEQPFEYVCQRYAAYIVSNTGDVDILSIFRVDLTFNAPSWVPDLRQIFGKRFFYPPNNTLVSLSANGQELTVRGCDIGFCTANLSRSDQPSELSQEGWLSYRVKTFEDKILKQAATVRKVPAEELRAAWLHWEFRSIKYRNGGNMGPVLELYEHLRLLGDTPTQTSVVAYGGFDRLARLIMESVFQSDMMLLHNGQMARVYREGETAMSKDVVCLCRGSEHPLVLRPHGGKYRLIGFAMVDLPAWDSAAEEDGRQNDEFFRNRETREYVIV